MGVRLFKLNGDRVIYTGTGPCFGFSAAHRELGFTDATHVAYSLHYDTMYGSGTVGGSDGVAQQACSDYVLEIARAVASLPHYNCFEVVQVDHRDASPTSGHWVLKAPVTAPADLIISGFFLCRNLIRSTEYCNTYMWLRDRGYAPSVSLIFSQLASRRTELAEWESEGQRWSRIANRESSMIDVRNFGADAFIRFVTGGEIPWYQDPWVSNGNSGGGYTRDSNFQNNEQFSSIIDLRELSNQVGARMERRLMCTALGIENDSPIQLPQNFDDDTLLFFLEENLPEDLVQGMAEREIVRDLIGGVAPIGSAVMLSPTGRYNYSDSAMNPHNMNGSITQADGNQLFVYEVTWENGNTNRYTREELLIQAQF